RLGRGRKQLLDLGASVGKGGAASDRNVFLATGVSEREIDARIARNLIIPVVPRIGEEVDCVLFALGIRAHRSGSELVAVAGNEHRESDFLHQFPGAVHIVRVVTAHVSLHALRSDNGFVMAAFLKDGPPGRSTQAGTFIPKSGTPPRYYVH